MIPKAFAHRARLAAIPTDAFMEVLSDTEDSPAPQYMPLSLLAQPVAGGVSPVYPAGANQSITGAGAVTLTGPTTFYTSTVGPDALTLADGTVTGQVKTVVHVADSGSGVLTPANFADGTDVTFTNVDDAWTGIWTGSTWVTIGLVGAVIG